MAKKTYLLRVIKKLIPCLVLAVLGVLYSFFLYKSFMDPEYSDLYSVLSGEGMDSYSSSSCFGSTFMTVLSGALSKVFPIVTIYCFIIVFMISYRENRENIQTFLKFLPVKARYTKLVKFLAGESIIIIMMVLTGILCTIYCKQLSLNYSDMIMSSGNAVMSTDSILGVLWLTIAWYTIIYSLLYTVIHLVSMATTNEFVWAILSTGIFVGLYMLQSTMKAGSIMELWYSVQVSEDGVKMLGQSVLLWGIVLVVTIILVVVFSISEISSRENANKVFINRYIGNIVFTGIGFIVSFVIVSIIMFEVARGSFLVLETKNDYTTVRVIISSIVAIIFNLLRVAIIQKKEAKKNEIN